jgi:TnpA family transposase
MPRLAILTPKEQTIFDNPPNFSSETRSKVFQLTSYEAELINAANKPTNKLCFMLQLIYFKHSARFFFTKQFRSKDIEYATKLLGLPITDISIEFYNRQTLLNHQKKILQYLGWQQLNNTTKNILKREIEWHANQQKQPKDILHLIEKFLISNKQVVPNYYYLCEFIGNAFNDQEAKYISILKKLMLDQHEKLLNELIKTGKEKRISAISYIQNLNQSERANTVNDSVKTYDMLKSLSLNFEKIRRALNLSSDAIMYHAIWVEKSKLFQLRQFANKYKMYLYLISYIFHELHKRTDFMIELVIKSVRGIVGKSTRAAELKAIQDNKITAKLISQLCNVTKSSAEVIRKISEIINNDDINNAAKVRQIEDLLAGHGGAKSKLSDDDYKQVENYSNNGIKDEYYFQALTKNSLKLQRKISKVIKSLDLSHDYAYGSDLHVALNYFEANEKVGNDAPIDFLNANEKKYLYKDNGNLNVALYKAMLFEHVSLGIKAGKLYSNDSYQFASMDSYLINYNDWYKNKDIFLKYCSLNKFTNFKKTIETLEERFDLKLDQVNKNFSNGDNIHLTIKNNKIKVKTPNINYSEDEFISSLFAANDHVPILDILSDINNLTNFTKSFVHHNVKNVKMAPTQETIFAGLIGRGCNIGINRMANISKGITEDILRNTVNWFFSLENIQEATNKVIGLLNKLKLPQIHKSNPSKTHTSSDGQKISVSVNSIHANYSFKYYGKDQGVSVYSFIDERGALFYDTIISPTEREAAYVIDGLMANKVVQSDIHSTDTHGFTEIIFAITHLIDVSFAPRIKRLAEQNIYGFKTKKQYQKMGLSIYPDKKINLNIIEKRWDEVLRFIATILHRKCTASLLLKRLNSYSHDNPNYKALKEFGRIPKSIFILTIYDDVVLRQMMEKQLSKIEQANRFSKAIRFSNSQELKEATMEEQRITIACKTLIQNCIIVWNYLYLSQVVINAGTTKDRAEILEMIKSGSAMCWKHINFHGEYDFTKSGQESSQFDLKEILALQVL